MPDETTPSSTQMPIDMGTNMRIEIPWYKRRTQGWPGEKELPMQSDMKDYDMSQPEEKLGEMSQPSTIPMSPRNTKRGRGEERAFFKRPDRGYNKIKIANQKSDPFNVKRSFASKAFTDAWTVLKNYGANAPRMPPTEEESYGGISHRNHPLFGQPGYRPSRLEAPTPLSTDAPKPLPPPTFDEGYSGALQDMPENEMDLSTPSDPFRGEPMSPQKAKLMAMIHSLTQG